MRDEDVLARIHLLAATQDGVVTRRQAAEAGADRNLPLRILRAGRWRVLYRGSYWVAAGADGRLEPGLRTRARAALLACGPRAAATGVTAARLHGLEGLPRDDGTVDVVVPAPGGQRPGIRLHRRHGRQVTALRGLPATTVPHTLADLTLTLPRPYALGAVDSALHQGLLPDGTDAVSALLDGRRGAPAARALLPLADGRAESPLETRLRLVCLDAGLPPGVLQWPLQDPVTGHARRIDLGWPGRWVGVEADGRSVHGRTRALYEDRHRQNGLLAAYPRLVLLRFTWEDAHLPEPFLAHLRRALEASRPW